MHEVLQDSFSYGTLLVAEYPILLLVVVIMGASALSTYLWMISRMKQVHTYDTEAPKPQSSKDCSIGILAMEVYFPSKFVSQSDLETFNGVSCGKYTKGLGQDGMAFVSDREDINSIALTVVHSLLEKYDIDPCEIGRLEVGTETLTDKSKSTKTILMDLFRSNAQMEGVTSINACYGGTAALFNSIAWIESSDWDGRYALVVAADVAVYAKGPARPTGGCGAVAMLIGPNAPLCFEQGLRTTHSTNVWDFYKPDPHSEYPTVDGVHSQECYLRALDDCYQRFCDKNEALGISRNGKFFDLETNDFAVFHSPYNKLVQKSFARLLFNDFLRHGARSEELTKWKDAVLEKTYGDRELDLVLRQVSSSLYSKMVAPSCVLSQSVGNCYTASVFSNLACLVDAMGDALADKRIAVFSYGSGSMASMYAFRGRHRSAQRFTLERMSSAMRIRQRLRERQQCSPSEFQHVMDERERGHGMKNVTPKGSLTDLPIGTYYLASINDKFQRTYARRHREEVLDTTAAVVLVPTRPPRALPLVSTQALTAPSVVITGISAGLPGQERVFDSANIDKLLTGVNGIGQVPEALQDAMLAKRIKQLQKRTNGGNVYHAIESKGQGIKLCGTLGKLDLEVEYGIPKSLAMCMDKASQAAVAAGLEALKQAGLVEGRIDQGWGHWRLPDAFRDCTGIIFASSFPALDAAMSEAARFANDSTYEFDRKFLFRVLVLANAQLAQIIGARGPNTQLNAACASTTQAIGMAQDWLALGRCERVVVISGDTASGENLMEWIGSGFRALGAASIAQDVCDAALPFDCRRNGMILSSGAVGMVLETKQALLARRAKHPLLSVRSVCGLLASQYSNSAYHGAALDADHIAFELNRFLSHVEQTLGVSKREIARNGVYFSHETFTNASATTSCAYSEVSALRRVFGADLDHLIITNTKGFTGHPMGVSFEDVAAVACLQYGMIPPVANFFNHDVNLGAPLSLPVQAMSVQKKFALRFAAGFGSQLAITLYGLSDGLH